MVGGGATHSTWNFGSTGPRWSEITDFEPIHVRSASAVTPSEKRSSLNTNRKSSTRFPMRTRWSSYVASKPPKRGSKTKNGRFPCKIALCLTKDCYKVYLCENCQWQSCKAFIDLTIRWKMCWTSPSMWKFDGCWPTRLQIADFLSIFGRSASAVTYSEKKFN